MHSRLNAIRKELIEIKQKLGMSEHTPGPWKAEFGQRYGHIVDCEGYEFAYLCVERPFSEVIANCHLMAAAPDMLETLCDIVGMLNHVNDMRPEVLRAAREAIARATGGQA